MCGSYVGHVFAAASDTARATFRLAAGFVTNGRGSLRSAERRRDSAGWSPPASKVDTGRGIVTDGGVTRPSESELEELRAENERLREEKREAEREAEALREGVDEMERALRRAANGDLKELRVDADAADVASAAETFNRMMASFGRTLSTAQEFAEEVDDASSNATSVAEDVRKQTERVEDSATTISDAMSKQRSNIDDVSSEISDLSATIEEITSTAENVANTAATTADEGEQGMEAAENAIDELDQIQQRTSEALASVEELTDHMEEIDEIVEFITDIAEQTNILALNANIEAARAGEEGAGFSVVAEEVKSLAEDTKEAAEEIEEIIEEIHDQSEETVEGMQDVERSVETGSETVEEALDALETIAERTVETNDGVQEIKRATNQQAQTTQEVAQMADEAAELSETTAEETDSVVEAIDAHRDQFEPLVGNIKDLSGQVTFLREELEEFEFDDDVLEAAGSAREPLRTSRSEASGEAVVVGSKQFTSNVVLAHLTYELLEENGDVEPVANFRLGDGEANYHAVLDGETDMYWSYTGTVMRQFVGDESDVSTADEVYRAAKAIESQHDVVLGEPTEMNNTWTISPPRVWCEDHGVHSLPDLAQFVEAGTEEVTLACMPAFRDRSDGLSGWFDFYDVSPDARSDIEDALVPIEDAEDRYETITTGEADMVQGLLADAWIDVHDLQPLDDPDNYFFFYHPVPIVNADVADAHPEVRTALDDIAATFGDAGTMRKLVRQITIGDKDPRMVARHHLEKHGLLR